jgi:uncharacterized protein YchJ
MRIRLSLEAEKALAGIKAITAAAKARFRQPIEFADASLGSLPKKFSVAGGPGRPQHQFELHARHFIISTQIKNARLGEAYLLTANGRSPLGVYALARSILESQAFTYYTLKELPSSFKVSAQEWTTHGEKYLSRVRGARLATRSKARISEAVARGVPELEVTAPSILTCLDHLAKERSGAFAWARDYYDFLCDFVHPNAASQGTTVASRHFIKQTKFNKTPIVLKLGRQITRYAFHSQEATENAVNSTAPRTFACLDNTRERMNEMVPEDSSFSARSKNSVCPCGSRKSFKNCCGRDV